MTKIYNNIFSKTESMIVIIIFTCLQLSNSQTATLQNRIKLSYDEYLRMVISTNVDFIAEKYNVDISKAAIEAAGIFQDPAIAFDWSNTGNEYSLSTEISKSLDIRQKRKARINLAKSENLLSEALLNDYFQNLRADATLEYATAIKQDFLYKVMQSSYQMVKELARNDSIRVNLGSIKSIDAIQSNIEAGILLNQLTQLEAERDRSLVNLLTRISSSATDTLYMPVGNLIIIDKVFNPEELSVTALNNRADLQAALLNINSHKKLLISTRKERLADVDIRIGVNNTYLSGAKPSNPSAELFGGITLPLRFSNMNKGELKIAQYQIKQAELQYRQVEINIQNEVLNAYNQYVSLSRQVDSYNMGLLDQAKTVLDGKVYSYSRGETSLLEVLNAQRTYNDLQISYHQALYDCFVSLIELERAAGIWDIEIL